MEVFSKIQYNLEILTQVKHENMFPENIFYPNQQSLENLTNDKSLENKNLSGIQSPNQYAELKLDKKNSNSNLEDNFNALNVSSLKDNETDAMSLNKQAKMKNQKKLKKTKIDKNIKYFKKLKFSGLTEIWDILLDNDILAFCGKNIIKILILKNHENKLKSSFNLENDDISENPHESNGYLHNSKSNSFSHNFEDEITFTDPNEEFYCLATSEIEIDSNLTKILAVGGTKSIIKILDLYHRKEYLSLIGQRNEIYDLRFHPLNKNILLSAGKDYSIRIWNVINGLQIALFGGPKGHFAEVLSIDWHLSGDFFVSSSIDNTVKIWEITTAIKENMIKSNQFPLEKNEIISSNLNSTNSNNPSKKTKNKFKTITTTKVLFSSKTIHENYVDSVKFNGNFIISKSMDGVIKEWLPVFNKESDYHMILNSYIYEVKESVWYMKLGFDIESNLFATGNTQGKLFIFKINSIPEDEQVNEDFNYYFNNSYIHTIDTGISKLIRSVAVFNNKVAFGNSDGTIYFAQLNKST